MSDMQTFVCPHALIKNGDKYLIMLRSPETGFKPNEWDIPGGHFNEGEEDPLVVLNRETFEEAGIVPKVGNIIYLFSEIQSPTRHQFQAIYECEYQGDTINLDPVEHSEYRWATVDEMKELPLMKFLRSLVDNVLSK
jgi:8-oxo-dGTP pyrophosphatase MutT (NUDIX family)